jgi:hypothetical protein
MSDNDKTTLHEAERRNTEEEKNNPRVPQPSYTMAKGGEPFLVGASANNAFYLPKLDLANNGAE